MCCNFSWVINERETEADTLWSELHVAWGESSYVLYRHKFHGLFIAGILRETEMDEGRRDRGEGEKCQVSTPEVLCIIAERKRKVLFSLSLLLSLFFVWLAHLQ